MVDTCSPKRFQRDKDTCCRSGNRYFSFELRKAGLGTASRVSADENTAEAMEELSKFVTGGMKLSNRVGNGFVLFYLEGGLSANEAEDLGRTLDAAKTILDLYKPKG